MSNPTGDALVAAGIKDTQRLPDGHIKRPVTLRGSERALQIFLGVVIGAIVVATILV